MANAQSLYVLLNEIFLILNDGDRQLFSHFNLTPPRYYALLHLGDRPGLTPSELSKLLLCDRSNTTRLIKGLETEGLIRREPNAHDRRSYSVFLTIEGLRIADQARSAHQRYNQMRFSSMPNLIYHSLQDELSDLKSQLVMQLGNVTAATGSLD